MELQALLNPEGRLAPFRIYAQLHEVGDASPMNPRRDGYALAVHGHDAVAHVLRDSGFRQIDIDYLDRNRPRWREHACLRTLRNSLFFSDGPEHTRMRRVIASFFTARRVAAFEPEMTKLIHDRIDHLARVGADGTVLDFMTEFAYDVPSRIVGDLLGVPEADRDWCRPRVTAIGAIFELDGNTWSNLARADVAATELTEYFTELVRRRRDDPRDDLASELVRVQEESPGRLSFDELVANLITTYNAGFVTTTHMFGNGLRLLLEHPHLRERITTRPESVPAIVEEILRLEPPVQFTIRYAMADTEVGGHPVRAGDTLLVLLGAANRDPRHFPDPDAFDPDRVSGGSSLSFSLGGHYCLGASMTRMEGAIAFPALFERLPGLRLAGQPTPQTQFMFRGHDQLPIQVD
ncbi:cytochrome P450 [Catellatospora tritici]|uniref:cytochrome P450 n=1 Tax=Catellatospora tritici TaxID=2851566 RepID=UPI001C2D9042|nr:cytochrome P450 [Catellatospora tritici]MBV1854821.1 cytochrome P450 [Catellatospora tritici]